jgi:rare lipoprotein A
MLALAACAPGPSGRKEPAPPEVVAPRPAPAATQPPKAPATLPSGPGNPPFYEVFGERYYVLPSSEGYKARGIASWYGAEFHGRRTSSGVDYDMTGMTAAHRVLPLPSLVRVTNLGNGRSVVVTVNDRGPFKKSREIDLSYAAAVELDMVHSGTAEVEVEAVSRDPPAGVTLPAPVPPGLLFMQVGAYRDRSNAERMQATLAAKGVSNTVIRYAAAGSAALYRVRVGPLAGPAEYDALADRLAGLGLPAPQLVTEPAPAP